MQKALLLYVSYPLREALIQGREARVVLGALNQDYRTKLSMLGDEKEDKIAKNKLRIAYMKAYAKLLRNKETNQSSRAALQNNVLRKLQERGEAFFGKQQRLIEKLPLVDELTFSEAVLQEGEVYSAFVDLLQYRQNDALLAKTESAQKSRDRLVEKFADEMQRKIPYDAEVAGVLVSDTKLATLLATL